MPAAALLPAPGFTFTNMDFDYSADNLKNSNAVGVPVTGNYSFWLVENIFEYAPATKILGGQFTSMAALNLANGSLTADLPASLFGVTGGGEALSDTWVLPVNLGWHLKRVDTWVGYAFVAPTGAFSPGATSNVGSGYWGNNLASGTTFYVTKNKATQLNMATNWEFHGTKRETNIIPGQAFTDEWGVGQIIPLKKARSRLVQLGVIGYDHWQVSTDQGLTRAFPYYSMHAIRAADELHSSRHWRAFFKYEPEYLVKAWTQGRTFVFGFSWTLRDPKAATH